MTAYQKTERIVGSDGRLTQEGQRKVLVSAMLNSSDPEKKAAGQALVKALDRKNVGVVVRGRVGFLSDPE